MQGLGSGTCCVTAVIEGKELMISNVGDCRAVLCRGGKAEALTKDHRASQDDERKRIEDKVLLFSKLACVKFGRIEMELADDDDLIMASSVYISICREDM